jgi:Tfp pilus assembly protein PilN
MGPMLILWIVWAGVLAILLILLAYRGTITRYEEDQMFLDDCADHQKKEQTEILAKVSKIQPFVRIATGATCVLSACILGIYVWDAVRQMM